MFSTLNLVCDASWEAGINCRVACDLIRAYYVYIAISIVCAPPVADMYSLEALKQVCMLQIPKLLTEDNVVDILYSISQSEGLGKHQLQQSKYRFIIAMNVALTSDSLHSHNANSYCSAVVLQLYSKEIPKSDQV